MLTDALVQVDVEMLDEDADDPSEQNCVEGVAKEVLDQDATEGFVGYFVADLAELDLPVRGVQHIDAVVDAGLKRF